MKDTSTDVCRDVFQISASLPLSLRRAGFSTTDGDATSHCTPPLARSLLPIFFLCQHNAGMKLESVSLSLIGSA